MKNPVRTKFFKDKIREHRKDLPLAVIYEKECARFKATCGYEAATDAAAKSEKALHSHINAIMLEPSKTMTGVVIKAQALCGWNEAEYMGRPSTLKDRIGQTRWLPPYCCKARNNNPAIEFSFLRNQMSNHYINRRRFPTTAAIAAPVAGAATAVIASAEIPTGETVI